MQQPNINPDLPNHPAKKQLSLQQYLAGIYHNDRAVIARAITLTESTHPKQKALGQQILDRCYQKKQASIRIGITGSPGVGKSTFIETFGLHLLQEQHKIAILAIDPSSSLTSGSILGDKTRMPLLSNHPDAFIRPTAAGKSLGGVARNTRQAITICEAAGYDILIIETVGVGQSETLAHSMVDFFLLLIAPGAGDELQGIKRGIVEMADLIAVNKADGDRIPAAEKTKRDYLNALHLFPAKESGCTVKAITCSATEKKGIPEIWTAIKEYQGFTEQNGYFLKRRKEQAIFWLHEIVTDTLKNNFYQDEKVKQQITGIEQQVLSGKLHPVSAARQLLDLFYK